MKANCNCNVSRSQEAQTYLPGNSNRIRLRITAVVALILLSGCRYDAAEVVPVEIQNAKAVQDITAVLMAQQDDWNNGDREAFMEAYWRSDSLRFVSSGSVNYGWQATLDNYHRRYPTQESMGSLTFSELDVRPLSSDWATAFGRFTLVRSEQGGGDLTGLYTLVLHRMAGSWKIVQDHTSVP